MLSVGVIQTMSTSFEKAVAIIQAKPAPGKKPPKMDIKTKLTFYALFKQATEGDVTGKEPSKMDMANYYKYKARMQCKGMSKDAAKAKYVEAAKKVLPADLQSKL